MRRVKEKSASVIVETHFRQNRDVGFEKGQASRSLEDLLIITRMEVQNGSSIPSLLTCFRKAKGLDNLESQAALTKLVEKNASTGRQGSHKHEIVIFECASPLVFEILNECGFHSQRFVHYFVMVLV